MIEDELIRKNLRALKNHFQSRTRCDRHRPRVYQGEIRQTLWTLWAPLGQTHVGHSYEGDPDAYSASHDVPFDFRTGSDRTCVDRRDRLDH